MEIIDLSKSNSLIGNIMYQLRDVNIQRNKSIFRANIRRLGQIMAYEISKKMHYKQIVANTPLGTKNMSVIDYEIVVAAILRAALPLQEGLLSYFTEADSVFIAAYRQYSTETDFEIKTDYISGPDVKNKVLLLADPMLATAASLITTYHQLTENNLPVYTHIVSVIAAQPGLDNITQNLQNQNISIWTCAIDPVLNSHGYIVPGLGDAGDLAYGSK